MTKNNEKEKGGIFYGRYEKEAGEKAEVEQGRYGVNPVSYTHLDVYKRQPWASPWGCGRPSSVSIKQKKDRRKP